MNSPLTPFTEYGIPIRNEIVHMLLYAWHECCSTRRAGRPLENAFVECAHPRCPPGIRACSSTAETAHRAGA